LPAPLRSSDNTGRLSAGQYGVVVPLLSGGRQCVLGATGYLLDCVCYVYVFQKKADVDGEIFII